MISHWPRLPAPRINTARYSLEVQYSFWISSATISNMKIILTLFGFFLAARCLPAPGVSISQGCKDSKCSQWNGFSSDIDHSLLDVDIGSKCLGGECDQETAFGVDFSKDHFFSSSSSDSDTFLFQHCEGSDCKQQSALGRKKRTVTISQET